MDTRPLGVGASSAPGSSASLSALGVAFDVWTSGGLHPRRRLGRARGRELREAGHVYEADGATWFRSTAFGDDKDRVINRSNGQPTYFAADIGYVSEKFSRGFDELIYIWGEDHHGAVARCSTLRLRSAMTRRRSASYSSPGCASSATAWRSA